MAEETAPDSIRGKTRNKTAGKSGGKALGDAGERLVATWLEARGHRVVERNWRSPYGEIDIITREGNELVFVEVKTRRGEGHGAPEEALTSRKRAHLIAATQLYLMEHVDVDAAGTIDVRIDVVAVQLDPTGRLRDIRHYRSAIALEEE